MRRRVKLFIKANNFPWETFKKYWKNSSRSELLMDILFPFIISAGLMWLTSFYIDDFSQLIEKFQQLSGQLIAAISILAGFNIASITIISTANEPTNRLRQIPSTTNRSMSMYEVLISFFTWAVIIQLIVVLVGIILFYAGSLVPSNLYHEIPIWAWIVSIFVLFITIHSMFISIRNMKTLFLYVTYTPPSPPPPGT
ncbi:hypothetical protein NYE59_23005 [Paenibacillus sp. FSL L8-0323]|uniref:hypothetical protein n=1 Tax=Paenibacillus sp. FSL L8-0323 TaxID=2975330 RepID=UPI0030F8CE08